MSERSDGIQMCTLCWKEVNEAGHCECKPAPSAVEAKGEIMCLCNLCGKLHPLNGPRHICNPEPSLGQKLIEAASECLEPNAREWWIEVYEEHRFVRGPCTIGQFGQLLRLTVVEKEAYQKLERELAEANKLLKAACDQLVIFKNDCDEADEKVAGLCEALWNIAKKDPSAVNQLEAADMACEFRIVAREALKRFGDGKL